MAGDELTLFASRYPQRTIKLVYYDAAFDRAPEGWIAGLSDPTNKPGMMQRIRMEALGLPGASDIHVDNMPPPDQWAILVATHKAIFAFRPDYTKCRLLRWRSMLSPVMSIIRVTGYQPTWTQASAREPRHGGNRKAIRSYARMCSNFAMRFLTARS